MDKEHAPSVVDGKLMRTSVSQLQNADGCMRQWAMPRVFSFPKKPEGAGQARGRAGHKRIEDYLKSGDTSGLEHLELLGIKRGLVPESGTGLLIEHPFHPEGQEPVLYAHDIPLIGYIDLINLREAGLTRLVDWKYKKPWNGKLGFDAEDLINPTHEAGIQMIGYAEWARLDMRRAPLGVDVSHVTFQTSAQADVKQVTAHLAEGQSQGLWVQIADRLIPRMKQAAASSHWKDVEPNESLCDAYGGCPYRDPCQDRMARITASFKQFNAGQPEMKSMGTGLLSELVNASQAATPPTTPPRKLVITEALTAGKAMQGLEYIVNGVKAKFLCNTALGPATFASFMPTAPGQPPLLVAVETEITAVAPPIVLPPDAPKSDPVLASKPAPGTLTPANSMSAPGTMPGTAPLATAPAPEAVVEPKKTRAKKAAPAVAPGVTEDLEADEGVSLYFGCSPVGKTTQTLDAYVAALDVEIQQMAQVQLVDLRVANDQALGFGRWKGFLAKLAKAKPPPAGHYVVTPGDERVDCVAAAIVGSAQNVVIGR